MLEDRGELLFFDASCLVAAAASSTGGSRFLLELCAKGYYRAVVSEPVLMETEFNVTRKLPDEALRAFHGFLASTPMIVAPVPKAGELRSVRGAVSRKDEHVLAAACASGARYFLTLDRPLAAAVNARAEFFIAALTPGEFIRNELPKHPDFSSGR